MESKGGTAAAIALACLAASLSVLVTGLGVNADRGDERLSCRGMGRSESHDPVYIVGNAALDAFCSGNGTDGLTPATAHVIGGYDIDAGGSGSCIARPRWRETRGSGRSNRIVQTAPSQPR